MGVSMHTKEEEKAYFRKKLKPIVLEVMERLDAEQHRREIYEFIQARKRGDEPCMSEV
jgi:hypothetical protein